MDTKPFPLRFEQMEQDLYSALESDLQNQIENDAKLRAISQRVSSYEEFRELVKGAHLKAITLAAPGSKNPRNKIWNSISSKRHQDNESPVMNRSLQASSCSLNLSQTQMPTTSSQFICWWKQSDTASKLMLLYKLGPAGLGHLFRIDIPTELLGEIIHTLLSFTPNVDEIAIVVGLLEALTEVKRFSLSLQFLNSSERTTCQQLIQKLFNSLNHQEQDLAELGITEWTLQELRKKYQV